MTNVIDFTGATTQDVESEKVLKGALEKELDCCVVIGMKDDRFYLATSTGDIAYVNLLMDLAKQVALSEASDGMD